MYDRPSQAIISETMHVKHGVIRACEIGEARSAEMIKYGRLLILLEVSKNDERIPLVNFSCLTQKREHIRCFIHANMKRTSSVWQITTRRMSNQAALKLQPPPRRLPISKKHNPRRRSRLKRGRASLGRVLHHLQCSEESDERSELTKMIQLSHTQEENRGAPWPS